MSVNVLTFSGGDTDFALAADSVATVSRPTVSAPHLADLLPNLPRGRRSRARSLRMVAAGDPLEVIVDGPLQLVEVSRENIVPTTFRANAIVLGFARIDGRVVVLLDARVLVERLQLIAASGGDAAAAELRQGWK